MAHEEEFFDYVGSLNGRVAPPNRRSHHGQPGTSRSGTRSRRARYPVQLARTWCHLSQQVIWPRADAELERALRELRALVLRLPTTDLVKRVLLRIKASQRGQTR